MTARETSVRDSFHEEVAKRFGVLPNFFRSAAAAPGLIEELWAFAKSAYLDSPLPSLFKERLFVHLSRFCEARYCIVRHVGFLVGLGRAAGDAEVTPLTPEQTLQLLRRPVPDAAALNRVFQELDACVEPRELPEPETKDEARLFDALTVIFLAPARSVRARAAVRTRVGDRNIEILIAFLAFVRAAHYWTETHPEIHFEPDMTEWMERHPELAAFLLDTNEASAASGGAQLRKALEGELHERDVRIGRAEAAVRESEERFRQFANASSGALWIRDAGTLTLEYVSPAIAKIYGVLPDAFLGDVKHWAAAILPEDRDLALEHIERARQGDAVVHEFRIQRRSDQAFRWIRNTAFPLFDERGSVVRIGGIAEDVTEAKLAVEHQSVLLAELQHRVRNIMAIIRSITLRTGERAENVPEYTALMAGRVMALARVQTLLTRAANSSVGVETIVRDEVSAQSQQDAQYSLEGPNIELAPKAAEILTLAVHELATNALKYGALSVPTGRIVVRWAPFEKSGKLWLSFDWIEEGAPEQPRASTDRPRRRGFGSELIEGRLPYELGGCGRVAIEAGGAKCHLEFPLTAGASVLETDAPQRATVFGGALDMTGEADLHGLTILVVEDEYYLATDAARAIQGAGAAVMGPCPNEETARAELKQQRPDAVILDINLGVGPSFKLAETLKGLGIPFVFVTGYDPGGIPEEFKDVERLEKPVQLRRMVDAISKLLPAYPK